MLKSCTWSGFMDATKLRAWWWSWQGLDGSMAGRPAAEVLERSGWARSVGGVGPYLTLFARAAIGRQAADEAAAKLQIHELPSARGCTYVTPASDFALALKVGQAFGGDMKTARKLGVTYAEIDKLSSAIVAALAKGPLEPDELRESAGCAARSLGPEGTKIGLTTTLPLALGKLQSQGEIRRVPTNGRLDQQRYRYALWRPNPLAKFKRSTEEAYTELARRFFGWIGPANPRRIPAVLRPRRESGPSSRGAIEAGAPGRRVPDVPGGPGRIREVPGPQTAVRAGQLP